MKQREGFALIELLVASLIFSFVVAALVAISSTAHRHMFQRYRSNMVKTSVLLGMKDIQNNLSMATRLDFPAAGAQGDVLAFAVNVDQTTNCYPISAANPSTWHYYCLTGARTLYHHQGTILPSGAATPCGSSAPTFWAAVYPVPVCGAGGATPLTQNVLPLPPLFSRRGADGVNEMDTVMIRLHSFWSAATAGVGAVARDVDFSMNTVARVNRAQ